MPHPVLVELTFWEQTGNQPIVKVIYQVLVIGQMGVDGVLRRCFSGGVTLELRSGCGGGLVWEQED